MLKIIARLAAVWVLCAVTVAIAAPAAAEERCTVEWAEWTPPTITPQSQLNGPCPGELFGREYGLTLHQRQELEQRGLPISPNGPIYCLACPGDLPGTTKAVWHFGYYSLQCPSCKSGVWDTAKKQCCNSCDDKTQMWTTDGSMCRCRYHGWVMHGPANQPGGWCACPPQGNRRGRCEWPSCPAGLALKWASDGRGYCGCPVPERMTRDGPYCPAVCSPGWHWTGARCEKISTGVKQQMGPPGQTVVKTMPPGQIASCGLGMTGTPPNCRPIAAARRRTCLPGQVGTPPNCRSLGLNTQRVPR